MPYPDRERAELQRYLAGIPRRAIALVRAGATADEVAEAVTEEFSPAKLERRLTSIVRAMDRRQARQFLAGLRAILGPPGKPQAKPRRRARGDAPDGSYGITPPKAGEYRMRLTQLLGPDQPEGAAEISDQILARWVSQAVEGVTSIRDDMLQRIRVDLALAVREGRSATSLANQWLEEGIAVSKGTARGRLEYLAQDALGTLHVRLARFRQQSAGIQSYVWTSQRDDRVRSSHEDFDGQVFTWDEGSPEGHPGEPPNCRCYAVAVITPDAAEVWAEEGEELGGLIAAE